MFHQSVEQKFWDLFRKRGTQPTIGQYIRSTEQALKDAGLPAVEANRILADSAQVFAKKADDLRNEAADLVRQGKLSQARRKVEEAKKAAALGHKLPVPGRVGGIEKGLLLR